EKVGHLLGEGEATAVGEFEDVVAAGPAHAAEIVRVGLGKPEIAAAGIHAETSPAVCRRPTLVSGRSAEAGTISAAPSWWKINISSDDTVSASRSALSGRAGSTRNPSGRNTEWPQKRRPPRSRGKRVPMTRICCSHIAAWRSRHRAVGTVST